MKINHTIVHYVIGALAFVGAGAAYIHQPNVTMVPTSETKEVTHVRVSRFDWPSLGEKKTIDLGEAISKIAPDTANKVTIFCSSTACENFRTDLDDAFQIAFWTSEFEDRFVDSEAEKGIFVGSPGPLAEELAKAISDSTGLKTAIVPISNTDGSPIDGIGVIIGKSEGQ